MLFASQIKNPSGDLPFAYKQFGQKASDAIGANYSRLQDRQAQESETRGMPAGTNSYGAERFATKQGLDQDALGSALGGQIAQGSYQDAKKLRDYKQQKQIADLLGKAMRPDTFQQIVGGLNGGANAAGQYTALYRSLGPRGTSPMNSPSPMSMGRRPTYDYEDGSF